MKTVDFHTHILPFIDDGAKDVDESIKMLQYSHNQGVSYIVATSHYYSDKEAPIDFINRRTDSFNMIYGSTVASVPNILLGAEVLYFSGISKSTDIELLTINNTKTLLLEMPFRRWNSAVLNDVLELNQRFNVVLAHIDRYLNFATKNDFGLLAKNDIYFQVNSDSFDSFFMKRKLFGLMSLGNGVVLGSDCHNTSTRPPQISKAIAEIEKHFGNYKSEEIQNNSLNLLCIN